MRKNDKSYQNQGEKASKKGKKSYVEKANHTRQQRIENARKAVPVSRLTASLELQQDEAILCPCCRQPQLSIDSEQYQFQCSACKEQGDTIKLVRKALSLTYWGAIHHLERLARESISTDKPQTPPPPPITTKPQPASTTTATAKTNGKIHFDEYDLERIKREVDLAELIRSDGVELKRQGKDLVGCCPFHDDEFPSLIVTPGKNLWHCMGACQKGGSAIDWIMQQQRVSFREALAILIDTQPHLAAIHQEPAKPYPEQQATPPAKNPNDAPLLRWVVDYYHNTLKNTPAAQEYLDKRGISRRAIDEFKLGFADRSLSFRLPPGTEGKQVREQLTRLGIYRANGREHMNGSLVVPIFDEAEEVSEIYGRKICDRLRKGTPSHLYLPGAHRGIFNPAGVAKETILCEAIFDALSFWTHGIENVTASFGTSGFTEDHLKALIVQGTQKLYIAYDCDRAGDSAAVKVAEKLTGKGICCYRVILPHGMDANEYALSVDNPAEKLSELIERAQPMTDVRTVAIQAAAKTQATSPVKETLSSLADTTEGSAKKEKQLPPSPTSPVLTAHKKGEDICFSLGERSYRIRGLQKNLAFDVMRVNVRVSLAERFHIDTFDLYHARNRTNFLRMAAMELGLNQDVIKRDMGKIILRLEELQQQLINKALEPEKKEEMSEHERAAALAFLRERDLMGRITRDIKCSGLVGEETNAMMVYIAATSRLLDEPLGLIIQALSAAGKSSMLDLVLSMFPDEEKVKYSAMTAQSLFYMGEKNLKHKILAISEEEGAEKASYALKILQSEKGLTMASTGKDPKTGLHKTNEYRTEGPVQPMMTTTSEEIDEELQNRFFVLTPDERREQTRAIHQLQRTRETLEGMLAKQQKEEITRLHQNAQRLLRPLMVVNPYAKELTFLDTTLRTRRDHVKYLTLIRAIALLHQHQRPIKKVRSDKQVIEYIEVTPADIQFANQLANHILGTSLDEMAPQTRKMLDLVWQMVSEKAKEASLFPAEIRFTQRQVREYTRWGHTQTKIHLARLVEMEYLLVHRSKRGMSYEYELIYQGEGKDGSRFLIGLLDPEKLANVSTTTTRSGRGEKAGGRP